MSEKKKSFNQFLNKIMEDTAFADRVKKDPLLTFREEGIEANDDMLRVAKMILLQRNQMNGNFKSVSHYSKAAGAEEVFLY